jgi:hypothetical protein
LPVAVTQELVTEDAGLLVQEIGAARSVHDPGQLQIDELNAEVEVTSLAVPASRVGQRVRERLSIDTAAVSGMKGGKRLQCLGIVWIELKGF